MKRLSGWGCALIEGLSSAALLLIVLLNLRYDTVMAGVERDIAIVRSGAGFYFSLALWLVLLGLLAGSGRLQRALERPHPAATFAVCAAAYVLLAAYLMAGVNQMRITSDAEAVYYAAYDLRTDNFARMKGNGYLTRFPFQIGLVAAVSALMGMGESFAFLRWVNVALVLATQAVLCRAAMQNGRSRAAGNLTVALSFLITPQLLHILFIYGNIPSLLFMLGAVCALCAWLRGGKARFAAAGVALLSLACLVRTNMRIACIAAASVCVLVFLGTGKKRVLAGAVCALLCPVLLTQAVRAYYVRTGGAEFDHPMPASAWVAMGLQDDGFMAGWYNNYTDRTYYMNGYDTQAVDAQAKHDIRERLFDFKQDPAMALRFFTRKLSSTWCEPTFGALAVSGLDPQADCHTPLLRALYGGGTPFLLLHSALRGLLTALYVLAALYPILRRQIGAPQSAYALFAQVYFFGGFAFHLFWETKSMYVLPYVITLVPLAAHAALMLSRLAKGRRLTAA